MLLCLAPVVLLDLLFMLLLRDGLEMPIPARTIRKAHQLVASLSQSEVYKPPTSDLPASSIRRLEDLVEW